MGQDDIRGERDQFRRVFAHVVSVAAAPAVIDTDVLADSPTRLLKTLRKRREAGQPLRIVRLHSHQHADASHPLGLLRARRERPRDRRAAEQRDELAALHSITSSAVPSSVAGTSSPRTLAVCRLITNSNFAARITGRSAGDTGGEVRVRYQSANRKGSRT